MLDDFNAWQQSADYLVTLAVAESFLQLHLYLENDAKPPLSAVEDSIRTGMDRVLQSSLAVRHPEEVKAVARERIEVLLSRFESLKDQYQNQPPLPSLGQSDHS